MDRIATRPGLGGSQMLCSDRWLTSEVTVIMTQWCSTRSRVRARNLTVGSSQPATGG